MEKFTRPQTEHDSIDKGWAWMVLIGCWYIGAFNPSIALTFGIQIGPLTKQLHMSDLEISWLFNTYCIFYNSSLFLAGPLCETFGFRKVSICSSLIGAISYILICFARSTAYIIIVFGVLAGLSLGTAANSVYCVIPQFFEKRRGFALSSYLSFTAMGTIVTPHLVKYLIEEYSLSGSIIIYGGIILNCCVSGALFRPSPRHECIRPNTLKETSLYELDHLNECTQSLQHIGTDSESKTKEKNVNTIVLVSRKFKESIKALKSYKNLMISISASSSFIGFLNFSMIIPYSLTELGHPLQVSAWTLSSASTFNTITRIAVSLTVDRQWFPLRFIYIAGLTIAGVFSIWFSQVTTVTWIYLVAGIWGIGFGIAISLWVTVIIDAVGMESFTSVLSACGLTISAGYLLAIPVFGSIRPDGGSYTPNIIASGIFQINSAIIWAVLALLEWMEQKRESYEIDESME